MSIHKVGDGGWLRGPPVKDFKWTSKHNLEVLHARGPSPAWNEKDIVLRLKPSDLGPHMCASS